MKASGFLFHLQNQQLPHTEHLEKGKVSNRDSFEIYYKNATDKNQQLMLLMFCNIFLTCAYFEN